VPLPSGVMRANIVGTTGSGETLVHTVHMRRAFTGFLVAADMATLAGQVQAAWSGAFTPRASLFYTGLVYTRCDVYDLGTDGRAVIGGTAAIANTVKGSAGSTVPRNVACVASLQTGFPGRSARGRLYLGALSTTAVANEGGFTVSAIGDYAALVKAFLEGLNGITLGGAAVRAVVASPTKASTTPITAVRVNTVPDTQRRRVRSQTGQQTIATVNA
jgi:hypothetical protein